MKVYYADPFTLQLPPGHRFPAEKYTLLRQELLHEQILAPHELALAEPVDDVTLTLAHTPEYVRAVTEGTLDARQVRAIGLPWSPELVQRSRASVGGTLQAGRDALSDGIAGNLAGGTHHATSGGGQGFCVFNDLAVTARWLLENERIGRIAVVDLDVHQGNGTAEILNSDRRVFLFSMHGEKNFPFRRTPSTLDIDLPDGAGDDLYLQTLESGLERVFHFHPDIVLYQAGVDPLAEDRLGRMSLTFAGLAERDRMVLEACREAGVPVTLTLGGGYARPIDLTVQAHAQTYRIAKEFERQTSPSPTR